MISPVPSDRESSIFGHPRRWFLLYLFYSALLCIGFACLGFPKPHVDDPFYVGTAEHLARTGELYNPYARNWMAPFTPGKFLSQFPLYPFLLGGWMKLAGIGTASVLVFFALVNFLCCFFAGCFVRRARLSESLFLFLPWLILSLGQTQGLRSDLPGLCAFWIGVTCITYPSPFRYFLAALSASAAVLLWPVLLGFVPPFFLAYLVIHCKKMPSSQRTSWLLRQGIALLAGGVAAFLIFLWMIGFEWQAFRHDFLLMTSMRRPGGNSILEAFLGLSWVRYNHLFLGSAALLSLFFLYWTFRPASILSASTRLWIFEIIPGCFLAILLYAVNTQIIYFFFWLIFFAVAADFIRIRARKELILTACLSIGLWIQMVEGAKNLLPVTYTEMSSVTREIENHPKATLVFDEVAYRYLFNLQPPANSLCWLCLHSAPELGGSLSEKEQDQVWVMLESRAFPDSKADSNKMVLIK